MSRFKFRAWDKRKKKMLPYGDFNGSCFAISFDGELASGYIDGDMCRIDPEDMIIMQAIGLTDKNGVDIFEGDIIDIFTDNDLVGRGCVFWDEDRAQFMHTYQDVVGGELIDQHNLPKTMWCQESHRSHVIVIGNYYENPELMEKI